jgi:RNA polymerase sigma-70 factor (ECF subfamily)
MPDNSPWNWEHRALLADALSALPEPEAEVLWLYYDENLSFEGIGDRIGVSRKSIKGLWVRGMKALKRKIDESKD